MADNVTADAGSGGAVFAAASLSFSGDTAVVPLGAQGILSGSEGSWTYTLIVGGAGAVTAGVQRMTLASDDPGVASLASIKTAVEILDNAISGSEMQVDVVAALPAGTNNIGDVDVLTVPTDPFGANADAASATGSISAKLRFIAATGIPITGTVTVGSHAVTNAGTFVVQVDGTALTRLTDIETNTDSGAVVGNGAAATAQRVTLANDSTGIVAVASIAAGDNNIGNVDVATVPADPFGANADAASATGSISAKLRFIASTGIPITGTVTVGSHAVTNAGTFVVQVDGAALTSLQLLDDAVATTGSAITAKGFAAAGTDGTNARILKTDTAGELQVDVLSIVMPASVKGPAEPVIDSYANVSVSAAANATDHELVAAPGASKQIWIYGLVGTADTADGTISLQDSDNTALSGVMAVALRGGFVVNPSGNFSMPWIKVATNKALEIDTLNCGFKGTLSYAVVSV